MCHRTLCVHYASTSYGPAASFSVAVGIVSAVSLLCPTWSPPSSADSENSKTLSPLYLLLLGLPGYCHHHMQPWEGRRGGHPSICYSVLYSK